MALWRSGEDKNLKFVCRFQPLQELSEEDQHTVKRFNQQLQETFNVQFPKGSNPDLQLMQHLWEPLRVVHKPLMLHVVSEMSTFCTHLLLQVCDAPCMPNHTTRKFTAVALQSSQLYISHCNVSKPPTRSSQAACVVVKSCHMTVCAAGPQIR